MSDNKYGLRVEPNPDRDGVVLHFDQGVDAIPLSKWARISQLMKQKGYDIRGAEDARELMDKRVRNTDGTLRLPDWIEVFQTVGLIPASSIKNKADRASVEGLDARRILARATREFGLTDNPSHGGYIMPNGRFLDLSGGSGLRAEDHRIISGYFEPESYSDTPASDAMRKFMRLGAIRWIPEGPAIDFGKAPTPQQARTVTALIDSADSEIPVDVDSAKWGTAAQIYPKGTPGRRVVSDVQNFYRTGNFRQMSDVMKFHVQSTDFDEAAIQQAARALLDSDDVDPEPSRLASRTGFPFKTAVYPIASDVMRIWFPKDHEKLASAFSVGLASLGRNKVEFPLGVVAQLRDQQGYLAFLLSNGIRSGEEAASRPEALQLLLKQNFEINKKQLMVWAARNGASCDLCAYIDKLK